MRIGLEMFGAQTDGRHRGIGRYVAGLAAALADLAPGRGHELVAYAVDGLPVDLIPPGLSVRRLRPAPTPAAAVARLLHANPDRLDVLLFLNPLEMTPGFGLPCRPVGRGPGLAALVYDLIPLHFPRQYLDPAPRGFVRRYLLALERLRTFDRLLAISEATRGDVCARLDLLPDRVTTIGAACGARGFAFTPGEAPEDRAMVAALGLSRPFVLSVGATDPRKNLHGLVEAFALLPPLVRARHQLAVAGRLSGPERSALEDIGTRLGLEVGPGRDVVPTGPATDALLRALYRGCAAFAFPSLYEGFGLPILEALACGAAVVAGDNSSQPEAAGRAGLLVDAADPAALAVALGRVLTEPELAAALRQAGPLQARQFSWAEVASRTLAAVASMGGAIDAERPRTAAGSGPEKRVRVALLGPLPPQRARTSAFTAALAEALRGRAVVDLFHDAGVVPLDRIAARRDGGGCFDHRTLDRLDRVRPYHLIVSVWGDGPAHAFVAGRLSRSDRPGFVVLPPGEDGSRSAGPTPWCGPKDRPRRRRRCWPGPRLRTADTSGAGAGHRLYRGPRTPSWSVRATGTADHLSGRNRGVS